MTPTTNNSFNDKMKPTCVYVFGSVMPVPGLKRENDIILKTYAELASRYDIRYKFSKSVNYSNRLLSGFHKKLKVFYELNHAKEFKEPIYQTEVFFYKWISYKNNTKLKSFLAPINYHLFGKKLLMDVSLFSPDVIHANNLYSDGYMAYKAKIKFGIPYLLTLRVDPDYAVLNDKRAVEVLKNASFIICHSYKLKQKCELSYSVLRIPHGINNDFFIEQVRTHHKGDIFKIVSVTRLLSLKNIDLVLRSIIKLIEAGNKIEYTIIGEGPEEKRLKEFVEINNLVSVVTFKPWMSHESIIEELKKNHLFAMVSYPENLGRVYFESIAGSLPILGARESGAYDLLLKGHGAHYAYLSEESITESITEIIKDYNNVGRAAVEGSRYLRNFDWDRMTELYYSLIRKTRPQ